MRTWPGSLPGQGNTLVSTSLTEPMLTTFQPQAARSSFQDGGLMLRGTAVWWWPSCY